MDGWAWFAVVNAVASAGDFKGVGVKMSAALPGELDVGGGRSGVAGRGEMDAVVGENRVHPVGDRRDELLQKACCLAPGGSLHQSNKSELARSVDGNEKVELALGGAHLGEVDVEVTDGVNLETFFWSLAIPRDRQAHAIDNRGALPPLDDGLGADVVTR